MLIHTIRKWLLVFISVCFVFAPGCKDDAGEKEQRTWLTGLYLVDRYGWLYGDCAYSVCVQRATVDTACSENFGSPLFDACLSCSGDFDLAGTLSELSNKSCADLGFTESMRFQSAEGIAPDLYLCDHSVDSSGYYDEPCSATINGIFPADTTPPTIVSITPADGAVDVAVPVEVYLGITVEIQFSEYVLLTTVTADNFGISSGGVSKNISLMPDYFLGQYVVLYLPPGEWEAATLYTVTVSTGIMDAWGNQMSENFSSSFTTE